MRFVRRGDQLEDRAEVTVGDVAGELPDGLGVLPGAADLGGPAVEVGQFDGEFCGHGSPPRDVCLATTGPHHRQRDGVGHDHREHGHPRSCDRPSPTHCQPRQTNSCDPDHQAESDSAASPVKKPGDRHDQRKKDRAVDGPVAGEALQQAGGGLARAALGQPFRVLVRHADTVRADRVRPTEARRHASDRVNHARETRCRSPLGDHRPTPSSPSSCTDRGRRCTARRTSSSATGPRPRTWCRRRSRRRTPRGPGCGTSTRPPATRGRCW